MNHPGTESKESPQGERLDTSIIIPVLDREHDVSSWCHFLSESFHERNETFEILLLNITGAQDISPDVLQLKKEIREVRILFLRGRFEPSVALLEGFEIARGEKILAISLHTEIDPEDSLIILDHVGRSCDFACGYRKDRKDLPLKRIQSRLFNRIARKFTGVPFRDLNSGIMAMKSEVPGRIAFHGDIFPVLPILIYHTGFSVKEVPVRQKKLDDASAYFGASSYVHRLLDLVVLFYLIRFTRKPLRFFGSIGATVFLVGLMIDLYLLALKFMANPIAHRPLLLLGTLLIVLGIQTFSLGLIGEIIIYTHARKIRDFHIGQVLE